MQKMDSSRRLRTAPLAPTRRATPRISLYTADMGNGSRSSSKRTRTSSKQNCSNASTCGGGSTRGTRSESAAAQSLQVHMAQSTDWSGSQSQMQTMTFSGWLSLLLGPGDCCCCCCCEVRSAWYCGRPVSIPLAAHRHLLPSEAFLAMRPSAKRQQCRSSATTMPQGCPAAPRISAPTPWATGSTLRVSSSPDSKPDFKSPRTGIDSETKGSGSISGESLGDEGVQPCKEVGDGSEE
mmetsp:Transcript_114586/g.319087  ORF Transcript_114586/g.319087 Transcript_114586/m.319087 type:complete len:237 (+) Transcript_114586:375-1085(+)